MSKLRIMCLLLIVFCTLPGTSSFAQKKKKKGKSAPTAEAPRKSKPKNGMKPYKQVITKEAKSDDGLFTTHRVDSKLYYEIPKSMLDRDMLWVTRIAKLPSNFGGGFSNAGSKTNEQVIQWRKRDQRIDIRVLSFNNVSDSSNAIVESVRNNNFEPILYSGKIAAISPDSAAYVVDVTSLFTTDISALSGLSSGIRRAYKVKRLDKERSYIESAKSYPENIEVRHVMTYGAGSPPSNGRAETISLLMNQSMILLPEDKMQSRFADKRVGWFSINQIDYSSEALKSDEKQYIRRWRLVPKDIEAYKQGELVEPVKPIVYYLDPATPARWRPYFKQGIEDWNMAFEEAGFKNAIIAKDPPTAEEDSEFSPEDIRYSVVRYVASTTRNAVGPSVVDPRTGEIIESDIIWYHNHLRSYRNRLMIETGAANPAARTLNTPEKEIGEMMRMVIAHEVGHALGLPHNMGASSYYPTDSLRSASFTQKWGLSPSIMDYVRFNYVAQPEDAGVRFVRMMGPYDLYAINWGYRYIPGADSPEAEKPTLHQWVLDKADDPIYRFGRQGPDFDPRNNTESIGDDHIKASEYGLANLKRVVPQLPEWTTEAGGNYTELAEVYRELQGIWSRYIRHVIPNVGGIYETEKTADQGGFIYEPVPADRQRQAMQFLNQHAFSTPEWLLEEKILRNVGHAGALENVRRLQQRSLNGILDFGLLQRLIETEALESGDTYTLLEMMDDLRKGIFSEVYQNRKIDAFRRTLQRAYVDRMSYLMTEEQPRLPSFFANFRTSVNVGQSDIRAVVRGELALLNRTLKSSASRTGDRLTKYHLTDLSERIDSILKGDKE
ncbi:MAG: zinc-dependent metalloprotease [Bacteroidota bacterium]